MCCLYWIKCVCIISSFKSTSSFTNSCLIRLIKSEILLPQIDGVLSKTWNRPAFMKDSNFIQLFLRSQKALIPSSFIKQLYSPFQTYSKLAVRVSLIVRVLFEDNDRLHLRRWIFVSVRRLFQINGPSEASLSAVLASDHNFCRKVRRAQRRDKTSVIPPGFTFIKCLF